VDNDNRTFLTPSTTVPLFLRIKSPHPPPSKNMSDGGVVKLPDPDISFDLDRLSSKPTYRPTRSPVAPTLEPTGGVATTTTAAATTTSSTAAATVTTAAATTTTTTTTAIATTPSTQRNNDEYYSCPAPPAEVVTSKDDRGNVVSVEIPPPVSTVVVQYDFELQLLQELNWNSSLNLNSNSTSSLNLNSTSTSSWNSEENNRAANSNEDDETKQTSPLPLEREVKYVDSTILPEIQRRVGRAVASVLRENTENGDDADACLGYFVEEWRRRRRGLAVAQGQRDHGHSHLVSYSQSQPQPQPHSHPHSSRSSSRRLMQDDPGSPSRTKIIALSTSPAAPYHTLAEDDAPRQCSPPYEGCYVVRGRMDVTYVGYNEAGVASEIVHLIRREMEAVDDVATGGAAGLGDRTRSEFQSAPSWPWPLYRLKFLGPSSDDGHARTANTPSAVVSNLGQISSVLPESDGGVSPVGIGIVVVLAATFLAAVYAVFINDERVHVDEAVDKVRDKSGRVLTKSGKTLKSRKRNNKENKGRGRDKSQPLGVVEGDFDSDDEEDEQEEEEQDSSGSHHDTGTISHSYDLEEVVDWQSHRGSDGYIDSASNNNRQTSHSSSSPTPSKSQVAAAATSIAISSLSQAESSFLQLQQQQQPQQLSRHIPSSSSKHSNTQHIRADTPHSETPSYSANSSDAIHGYPSPTMALTAIHAGASVSGGSVRTTRSKNEHEKATPVRANKRAAVTGSFHRLPPVALVDRTPSVTTSSAGSGTHTSLRQQPHQQQHDPHHQSSPSNAKLNAAAAMIVEPSSISSSGNSIGSYGSRLQTVPEANLPPPAHDTPHKSKQLSYPIVSPSVVSIGSSHSSGSHRFWKDFPREIDEDSTFEAIEVSEVVHHHFDGDEEMWEV